jgi:hypothetical protein
MPLGAMQLGLLAKPAQSLKLSNALVKAAIGILAIAMAIAMSSISLGASAQDDTDNSTHTATGCLIKSPVANIYMLTDENGKAWDLRSNTIALDPHVGHTVKVTGVIPKDPKGSIDTSPQNHLLVTRLEMVRDSCKQP